MKVLAFARTLFYMAVQILICRCVSTHFALLFCVAFSKSGSTPCRRKNGIFFLQSFFFCAYFSKRKSVYQVLIAKGFSRFSLEKEAQRKAIKRKGRCQGLRALDRATTRGVSHAFSCLTYVSHLLRKIEK